MSGSNTLDDFGDLDDPGDLGDRDGSDGVGGAGRSGGSGGAGGPEGSSKGLSGSGGPDGRGASGGRPGAAEDTAPGTAGGGDLPGGRGGGRDEDGRGAGTRAGGVGRPVGGRRPVPSRRAADPVKALLHRHRVLCERAVDALEIAAGLEAHGVTDRTAARFRHRDVFSLAEEMYARVPRDTEAQPPGPRPPAGPAPRGRWTVLALLPGALCVAAVAALRLTHGQDRLLAAVAGTLAVVLSLHALLRSGPLSAGHRGAPAGLPGHGTGFWTCWLVGYALLGDGVLTAAVMGGPDGLPTGDPDGPWPLAAVPVLALALGCAPAAWCAHLFAVRARRAVAASRGLEEFAACVRPLLFGALGLFLGALAVLVALCGAVLREPAAHARVLTLGALLFLARLLTVHGFRRAPALVLTAAATAEGLALAAVFAGRLPGCELLAVPVETLTVTWGPSAVPTLACGATALTLLIHATRKLTRASAHTTPEDPC